MEVAEHGVRAPSADQANDVGVDPGAEEGHGAASAESAGGDVGGQETQGGGKGCGRGAEEGGDHGRGDMGLVTGFVVGMEEGVGGGAVAAQMEDPADNGADRTCKGVAAAAVGNDLAAYAVLLDVEGEGGEGGAGKIVGGACKDVEAAVANKELGVAKAEGVGSAGGAVLAWAE